MDIILNSDETNGSIITFGLIKVANTLKTPDRIVLCILPTDSTIVTVLLEAYCYENNIPTAKSDYSDVIVFSKNDENKCTLS